MNLRSIQKASGIARCLHILILAAIVAPGIYYRSQALIGGLTAVWFVLFAAVYLFVRPRRG
jgi:hypothetical protein